MILVDPSNGNIIDANPAACSYYGFNRVQIQKHTMFDISTKSEGALREILNQIQNQQTISLESVHYRHDGAMRHVLIQGSRIPLAEKDAFFFVVHDINSEYEKRRNLQNMLELAINLRNSIAIDNIIQISLDNIQSVMDLDYIEVILPTNLNSTSIFNSIQSEENPQSTTKVQD